MKQHEIIDKMRKNAFINLGEDSASRRLYADYADNEVYLSGQFLTLEQAKLLAQWLLELNSEVSNEL